MKVSYKKLWKLLIDRDMKKKDLQLAAGLSSTTIAKLSNHENVSMDVLIKVCKLARIEKKIILSQVLISNWR
jgi:putative transcriptional regulator